VPREVKQSWGSPTSRKKALWKTFLTVEWRGNNKISIGLRSEVQTGAVVAVREKNKSPSGREGEGRRETRGVCKCDFHKKALDT